MWEVVATLALLGGASLCFGHVQARERLRIWQAAVASCGLPDVVTSAWGPRLKAQAGPLEVRLTTEQEQRLLIVIVVRRPLDFLSVSISRELPKWLRLGNEIEIGDEPFDSTFYVTGPVRLVRALLDEPARRRLISLNARSSLKISFGEIRVQVSEEEISDLLPLVLDIGRRFSQPVDIPRRLAENASRDSEAGVRLQNLLLLLREFPEDPATVEALRAACTDASPEIRLRAARELGAEGRDVLRELAEHPEDDAVSAEAVSILDRELPFERTRAILDRAIRTRSILTARACLEVLGRSGAAEAVETLAKVMAEEQVELAASTALALGATGSPAAEPPLILALQREEDDVRVAAAKALGRVGSAAAVLPLKEAAERSRLDLELRRATRQAIAEIQSRLPGASPGQLSLAGAEVGQLSLAQAEAGQLSLAADAVGQLSLPPEEPGQLSLSEGEET